MSNLSSNDSSGKSSERRVLKRRTTSDRRSFQRFEPGKITADRRRSLADRRDSEGLAALSLQ